MHAGFPYFMPQLQQTLKLGATRATETGDLPAFLNKASGRLLAPGMAVLLKLGFGFLLRNSLLDAEQSKKAKAFFEDNFVIIDPNTPEGRRYYQGKFLICTSKRGDDMNVLMKFCPDPGKLYVDTPFGEALNPLAVVDAHVLKESEAEWLQQDPQQVDLVIRFRDVESILGLLQRQGSDIVGLMMENVVQVSGHLGHLFKLGAIAADIQLSLDLPRVA